MNQTQTEFLITKDGFRVVYMALRRALEDDEFQTYDKEDVEYLMEEIQHKILHNGTTRKNWQVVKYNNPEWKSASGRQQYSHYGTY